MGEKRQLPHAHAAALTPALYARAMTLAVAPAIATEVALAYHVIIEAIRCRHCNEKHLASMMHVTMKTMRIGDTGRIKLSNRVFREAQEGLLSCRRAGMQTGIWTLDKSTYRPLCEVLATFDRRLAVMSFYELMLASENINELVVRRKSQCRQVKPKKSLKDWWRIEGAFRGTLRALVLGGGFRCRLLEEYKSGTDHWRHRRLAHTHHRFCFQRRR